MSASLQIGIAFVFWTHSLERVEWSGFSWLKSGMYKIGYNNSHSRVSQCLTSIRKHGNRRSSEGLCNFKPSKGTDLSIRIILAGDIEMIQGPRIQCRLIFVKTIARHQIRSLNVKIEKRYHASCANLGDDELLNLESGNRSLYCTNCNLTVVYAVVLF